MLASLAFLPIQDVALSLSGGALTFSNLEILLHLTLAFALGIALALVYRGTHKGLSYSQSFTLTVVFVTVIVAATMMVIGGSLDRRGGFVRLDRVRVHARPPHGNRPPPIRTHFGRAGVFYSPSRRNPAAGPGGT